MTQITNKQLTSLYTMPILRRSTQLVHYSAQYRKSVKQFVLQVKQLVMVSDGSVKKPKIDKKPEVIERRSVSIKADSIKPGVLAEKDLNILENKRISQNKPFRQSTNVLSPLLDEENVTHEINEKPVECEAMKTYQNETGQNNGVETENVPNFEQDGWDYGPDDYNPSEPAIQENKPLFVTYRSTKKKPEKLPDPYIFSAIRNKLKVFTDTERVRAESVVNNQQIDHDFNHDFDDVTFNGPHNFPQDMSGTSGLLNNTTFNNSTATISPKFLIKPSANFNAICQDLSKQDKVDQFLSLLYHVDRGNCIVTQESTYAAINVQPSEVIV